MLSSLKLVKLKEIEIVGGSNNKKKKRRDWSFSVPKKQETGMLERAMIEPEYREEPYA